jgi:general secretion pathway protein K
MIVPEGERGAALLTVLLLVAVMATIAATAMDRIGIATRLTQNANEAAQARAWLGMAERLAAVRVEDMLAADRSQTTLKGGWMGVERSIALPNGALVRAKLGDGANCINLNGLVQQAPDGALAVRELGRTQFTGLMAVLGIAPGEADQIAHAAADYLDSDSMPSAGGSEDNAVNRLMIDPAELRSVNGVTERHYRLLQPWICALPAAELSPLNVNTLLPEQAPLLAMLGGGRLDISAARAVLTVRPADGFGSVMHFWSSPPLQELALPSEVTSQVRVRSEYFRLKATVASGRVELMENALIDARNAPARIIQRQIGGAA